VGVRVLLGVTVGVRVLVGVTVGVTVSEHVGVGVELLVGLAVGVADLVGVTVGVTLIVGVLVGVSVGPGGYGTLGSNNTCGNFQNLPYKSFIAGLHPSSFLKKSSFKFLIVNSVEITGEPAAPSI